jgi:hypothetical protein
VADPSVPSVIEKVNAELRSYSMSPGSEAKLTNPVEILEAIWGLKFCKG